MKHLIAPLALVAALAVSAPAIATPVEADPEAEARARILIPLTLQRYEDLDFGTIVPSATSLATVTIPANGGARSAAGAGVTLVTSAPGQRAHFVGAGTANQFVFIDVTNPGTLSDGGTNTITLIALNLDRPALIKINATRAFEFFLGGTIQIAPNQAEGLYEAEIDVTAQYL